MTTIAEYVSAVEARLPRWLGGRAQMVTDLRNHLQERVLGGEPEPEVVRGMEAPEDYAAALVGDVTLEVAPVSRRLAAYVLDVLLWLPLVALSMALFFWVAGMVIPNWPEGMGALWLDSMRELIALSPWVILAIVAGVLALAAPVLGVFYFPVAEAVWGTTVGKHLLGLCVVAENGTRVTWGKAIIRRIPFYFEFFWLDALFALFTKRRQRAFDHVAGTLVVRCPVR